MSYNTRFKSIFNENEIRVDTSVFKRFEFVIYALFSALGEFEITSANLYFTQYFKRFYKSDDHKVDHIFYILRKYYHQYYSKKQFEVDLKEYLSVPEKFRYFTIVNGVVTRNNNVAYFVDRDVDYEEMIEKYTDTSEKVIKFIGGQGSYDRIIRTGQGYDEKYTTKSLEFDIGTRAVPSCPVLAGKCIKNTKVLPLGFDWDGFKHELGPQWAQRPSIQISSCDDFDNEMRYKGLLHIVGLLGAGKSTYIIQETYRLLKDGDMRIGIVVPNVSEVIKTYEALTDLGIKASPIIGATQIDKHRLRFLNSKLSSAESFNDLCGSNMSVLDYLTGYCLLSHYSNDVDINESQYPCNNLKKDGSKSNYNCPLFNECGYFKKFIDLEKADVWITTSHSLLASKANQIIDPQRRTYYELFHDCLDVIFIDEADSVQEDFDHQFMTSEVFYGRNESIMRKFQKVEEVLKSHKAVNLESEIHRWIVNQPHLTQLLNRLEYLIINSMAFRKYLIEDTITPRSLFFSVVGDLADPESQESQRFISSLESFLPLSEELRLNEELMSHELFVLYDKFTKCPNVGNAAIIIEESIDDYIREYDLIIKKSDKYDRERLFKKKLELFIYIVLIDYYFRIQNSTIANLAMKLPEINTIFSPFKFYNKEFVHLLSESVIGNIFGYKLILDDENRLNVHLFNYSGIGRSLIEDWPYIKRELNQDGPAVVLLSGTSYAPASAHFHIEEEPTFLLKSEKVEGRIDQFINIKYDRNGNPIRISGVSDRFLKREKLLELIKALLNDIKVELRYWKEHGSNRKVLLIVNSYEQCRIVGDYLNGRDMSYRILSNADELKDDEINTSQIEEIPQMSSVDVLVAPLSIISRGYNIVDENGDSYFGSAFMLIRPYVSPDDLTYNYRILNSVVAPLVKKYQKNGFTLNDTIAEVRKLAFGMLSEFNEKKFWKHLDNEQRAVLAWYTFIPVKQAVGRMQRNGCDSRVFYCDGSFVSTLKKELTSSLSMLKAWDEILGEVKSHTGQMLYGQYLAGLSKAITDFEKVIIDIEEEELY
ncbi:hypothetical protein SAMN05446037_101769 [Anaerovirgula multivorans]|uniref:Uncharacterized protein n=1 Tax=Anaerovirgula multivorans TaxID=312168 RepID=A0A239GM64_9FIRM|nr:hypothetical protein [Anaerovirgula multivorans]SNS69868.1 hypothetical protein SAMN05446037_101769 [Anaerovirgula multivorans]